MTTLILIESALLCAMIIGIIKLYNDNKFLKIEIKKRKARLNHEKSI